MPDFETMIYRKGRLNMNENYNLQRLVTMRNPEYQDMVSVACYAIEHGFDVSYEGCGNLIVRLKPREPEN